MICSLTVIFVLGCGSSDGTSSNSEMTVDETTEQMNGSDSKRNNKDEQENVKRITLGHSNAEDHHMHESYMLFKELVEERTNGEIIVDIHHSGTLGGDREHAESVDTGTIEMALNGSMILGNYDPRFWIFDLPFMFEDYVEIAKIVEGEIGGMLADHIEGSNIRVVAYLASGFRNITSNKPIRTMEDLEGIKIRTLETPVHVDALQELGMAPTPLPFPEVYGSLQSGVIDAQENSNGNTYYDKFYEVQKYLTKPGPFFLLDMTIINENFYQSLTEEQQQIITESAQEAARLQRELDREAEVELLDVLETEGGLEIYEFPENEVEKIKEKVKPVYDQYREEIGIEFMERFSEELGRDIFEN